MSTPKTLPEALDALGPPDDVACRRLLALLGLLEPVGRPKEPCKTAVMSEPLRVRLSDD